MSEFRRRLLIYNIIKKKYATNWYIIDPQLSKDSGNATYPYYYAISVSGKYYYYQSKNPFYIIDNGSTMNVCMSQSGTYRNDSTEQYIPYSKVDIGTDKNGVKYYMENYTRTSKVHSNVPILIWKA